MPQPWATLHISSPPQQPLPAPYVLAVSPPIPAPLQCSKSPQTEPTAHVPESPHWGEGRDPEPYPVPGGWCSGVCTGGDTLLASEPTKPLSVSGDTMRCSCRCVEEGRIGAKHPQEPPAGCRGAGRWGLQSQGTHLAGLVLGDSAARSAAAAGQEHPWWLREPQGRFGCSWWLLSGGRGQVAPCPAWPWRVPGGQQRSSPLRGVPAGRGRTMSNGAVQPQMWGNALGQPALPWRLLTLKPTNASDVKPET